MRRERERCQQLILLLRPKREECPRSAGTSNLSGDGRAHKLHHPRPPSQHALDRLAHGGCFADFRRLRKTLDALEIRDLLVDGLLFLAPVDVDALVLRSTVRVVHGGGGTGEAGETRQRHNCLSQR